MTFEQWIADFSAAVGVAAPTTDEIETLLQVASLAAHGSERKAAPITCWLAAKAGITPAEAVEHARRISEATN